MLVLAHVLLGATCAVVLTLRQPRDPTPNGDPESGASRILDERLARGEIDEEEYRRRRSALLEDHHGPVTGVPDAGR